MHEGGDHGTAPFLTRQSSNMLESLPEVHREKKITACVAAYLYQANVSQSFMSDPTLVFHVQI